jgi:hybrid cluster-associated redox disulfide protein
MTVSKDIKIGELLSIDQGVIPILLEYGMGCFGCPASQGESIEEAAMVHGIDPEALLEAINKYLADK